MFKKPKLCIVSPYCYPLFNPKNQSPFGGSEVRVALIAKELAKRGNINVFLVVGDHEQPHLESLHGVTLVSWLGREMWGISPQERPRNEKNPMLEPSGLLAKLRRTLFSRKNGSLHEPFVPTDIGCYTVTKEMVSIYDEIGADIYTAPGNSYYSAELICYCLQRRRRFVVLSGSDYDYSQEYIIDPDGMDMYGMPHKLKTYVIEYADGHVVQNERQARMLHDNYSRSSYVIRNPIDLDRFFRREPNAATILWVGKSEERTKRPSVCIELARQLPQFKFVMIMTLAMQDVHKRCEAEARELSNLTLISRVPFDEVEQYFASAKLHLNTSVFEGFPNTFLQAAKYGVPTVSLSVDPCEMLSGCGAGAVCGGEFEMLKTEICELMGNYSLYENKSKRALEYVRNYHDKDKIIPQYESAFARILG